MFLVRYELGFYIPEDGVLHSHRLENLRSHMISLSIAVFKTGLSRQMASIRRKESSGSLPDFT
jgi:hypothetical protein